MIEKYDKRMFWSPGNGLCGPRWFSCCYCAKEDFESMQGTVAKYMELTASLRSAISIPDPRMGKVEARFVGDPYKSLVLNYCPVCGDKMDKGEKG